MIRISYIVVIISFPGVYVCTQAVFHPRTLSISFSMRGREDARTCTPSTKNKSIKNREPRFLPVRSLRHKRSARVHVSITNEEDEVSAYPARLMYAGTAQLSSDGLFIPGSTC